MLGPPTILSLIADSQKHVVNPANLTIQTRASIAATKGFPFHTSSHKSAWIIDSGATDHMTFDPDQFISRKSSTPSVVSTANDVWGPAKIVTPVGARWFVTFMDDHTCMTWVSLLKTKGEVSYRFQQFHQVVETQFHARIQTSLCFKTTDRQWKATGCPPFALRARRICFKITSCQRKATGRQKITIDHQRKMISCLHAVNSQKQECLGVIGNDTREQLKL
ncbi:unnamed protein product [Prunus armeniaca]